MDTEANVKADVVLAKFPRRNRMTGAMEQLWLIASEFQGRLVTHARIFYQGVRPTPGDDGWRPSKIGVTYREIELDQVIDALQRVKAMLVERGRGDHAVRPRDGQIPPYPRQPRRRRQPRDSRELVPWESPPAGPSGHGPQADRPATGFEEFHEGGDR